LPALSTATPERVTPEVVPWAESGYSLPSVLRLMKPISPIVVLSRWLALLTILSWPTPARAALSHYDAAISADTATGLAPLAKMTNALTFNDVNKSAFNFGNTPAT